MVHYLFIIIIISCINNFSYWFKQNTIFVGQAVEVPGTAMFNTLKDIDIEKRMELPVFEDTQMGIATGLALNGFIPVNCYPRFDFLILAMNQLVNHLDKIRYMSFNQFKPRVIIRTSIGSKKPLDGGIQHTQDYTKMFKDILTEVNVVLLNKPNEIFSEYKKALYRKDNKSSLIIEHGDFYNSK